QAADMLLHNYRNLNRDLDVVYKTAACYSINKDGGEFFDNLNRKLFYNYPSSNIETYRGCIRVPVGQSGCQAVRTELSLPENTDANDGCDLCLTDKCNGSAGLKVSLGAMLLLLVLGVKNLL
ncbi:hypothetical protein KR074_007944, partial [Drosophila pseudoananassae]